MVEHQAIGSVIRIPPAPPRSPANSTPSSQMGQKRRSSGHFRGLAVLLRARLLLLSERFCEIFSAASGRSTVSNSDGSQRAALGDGRMPQGPKGRGQHRPSEGRILPVLSGKTGSKFRHRLAFPSKPNSLARRSRK